MNADQDAPNTTLREGGADGDRRAATTMTVTPATRLFRPRWWPGVAAWATSPFNDRALGGVLLVANQLALTVTSLAVVVAAGSLVVRFRRARQAFTTRLREQLDLDTLSAELLAVVDQTMQPTKASLWLRSPTRATQDHSDAVTHRPP